MLERNAQLKDHDQVDLAPIKRQKPGRRHIETETHTERDGKTIEKIE